MVNATNVGESWTPECMEDELTVALVSVKRGLQAGSTGMDPGGFPILHHLATVGPDRSGHIAEVLHLDASTVSRHARSLVEDGLVSAERDPSDGRATVLALTDAGRQALGDRLRRHRDVLRAATADLTEHERAELVRLLHKLASALADQRENA